MQKVVITYEGDPLPSGDIASRLGGYVDMDQMEETGATDAELIEKLLGNKNAQHNNYQDFQAFLDAYDAGILIRTTGDIIAMSPPLIVSKAQIDELIGTLGGVLKKLA